jgi:hypothetical protein
VGEEERNRDHAQDDRDQLEETLSEENQQVALAAAQYRPPSAASAICPARTADLNNLW